MTIQPFPLIELAVKELIEAKYPAAAGKVGGDLSYRRGDALYVFVGLVPGGGSTDNTTGQWTVDIDVLAPSYATAMTHALALEALLIPGRHSTSIMRLDSVFQNSAPSERPWDDESAYRIGSTYVFTARRSG